MSKTLADIAQDAYTNCHPMQDGWKAAAEAVVAEVCDPKVYELAKTITGKWNAHLAVIEAARFMRNVLDDKTKGKTARECAIDCVMNAVDDLDSEEKQDG